MIAHLIAYELDSFDPDALDDSLRPLRAAGTAVQAALVQLRGTYGLAVMFRDWPEAIVAARLGSPLVIGVGDGGHYLASDGSPLVGHTDKIVYLADHEIAVVTADSLRVIHRDQGDICHDVKLLEIDAGRHRSRRRIRTTC